MSVRIFYDNTDFRLKGSRKAGRIIEKVIMKENRISGDLVFIFTDDETVRKINIEFLNHDYFTDVITFNYNENDVINGEVYISIDRIKVNYVNYNVSFKNEVQRVMIHGVLHLLGFDDKNSRDRRKMREKEEIYLEDFNMMWNEL